jgi:hypothetical protein
MATVWPEIEKLIAEGYSLIPVRESGDGAHPAKSPFTGWKKYQTERITAAELWHLMADRYNTTAVAMICGRISGGVEVIDVDNKNKPGIEASLFNTIQTLFPCLWELLRIHKSPSGGYHILYKTDAVAGNKKLASDAQSKKAFLETRGEGGYVLVPPSMGYTVFKDQPIPTISTEDRNGLIAICESFNEVFKVEEERKPKYDSDYYSVNPWDDFNKRAPEAETILTAHGWKFHKRIAEFIYFTRPSGTNNTIHATFMLRTRLYRFFTTNSEFETERCYQPSTVFSRLEHAGDKQRTFQWLKDNGYGKRRPEVEDKIIRREAARGTLPDLLPKNLSLEAVGAYGRELAALKAKYPYGVFWEVDEKEKVIINREKFLRVAEKMGWRYDSVIGRIVRIKNKFVFTFDSESEFIFMRNLKNYIKENDDNVLDVYLKFFKENGEFIAKNLKRIHQHEILSDTKHTAWKFYADCCIRITQDGWSKFSYRQIKKLIWFNLKQKRKFKIKEGGVFEDYLSRAIFNDVDYVEKIIGYLSHGYKDETLGYIIVLTEVVKHIKKGGGTGKNVFCNLFSLTTTVNKKAGSQIKFDEKFLQSWHGEKIMIISDVKKDFDYLFLKELSTGSGILKKLFIDETTVPPEKMPKFLISTGHSYEINDGGLKRRIIPMEFTEFFTTEKGVDVYYKGKHFPSGWDEDDYAGYDFIILRSLQRWLLSGLKLEAAELTEGGWRKQFEMSHPYMLEFIEEFIEKWIEKGWISNEQMKELLIKHYIENNIQKKWEWNSYRLNSGLEDYCNHHGIIFHYDVQRKVSIESENGITVWKNAKIRTFERKIVDEAPF